MTKPPDGFSKWRYDSCGCISVWGILGFGMGRVTGWSVYKRCEEHEREYQLLLEFFSPGAKDDSS